MNSPIDPTEREKFDFDKEIRLRETQLKEAETRRSRWTNPLIVALLGATAVGLGNILNSRMIAQDAHQSAFDSHQYEDQSETLKHERTAILEIIKMADPGKVQDGFCRLLKLNAITNASTVSYVQSYVDAHKGCNASAVDTAPPPTATAIPGEWLTASVSVPGCGDSGCYKSTQVCGPIPSNKKFSGNVRNFVDSFNGAWGEWGAAPQEVGQAVCRWFIQHSHNVARTVSFQYEVLPQ